MKIGLNISPFQEAGVAEQARTAEDAGLESVWIGDHLIPPMPYLDATLVLATAAAVTERLKVGFGVMVLPLRATAWAAKQVASLQHLSGDRVLLGIGSGGPVNGDEAFRAVGVPFAGRGARTDAALEVLPGLIAGKTTTLDGEDITLSPGATVPPILIGGGAATVARAARYGDEWYPAHSVPSELSAATERLAELAAGYGRPVPRLTVGVSIGLGDLPAAEVDAQVQALTGYGMSEDAARRSLVTGSPEHAAERFAELGAAGAHRVIGMPFPGDRLRQAELLGEVARILGG